MDAELRAALIQLLIEVVRELVALLRRALEEMLGMTASDLLGA